MEMLSKIAFAFEHGGIWMWPILGLQLFSFAVIGERALFLFRKRKNSKLMIGQKRFNNVMLLFV
jgi:biopolymer transport protein ExbB/TolQ